MMRYPVILALLVLVGCRDQPTNPPPPPTPLPPSPRTLAATKPATTKPYSQLPPKNIAVPPPRVIARRIGDAPKDPPPPIQLATRFDVYDVTLPAGSVSRNEQFWKIIDEQQIDPGTYDVLRRNGVRVGVAPTRDWPSMRELIADLPSETKVTSATGRELSNIELTMRKDIVHQSIFVFLPGGQLVGRTFERCDNLLALSFQQTPRKAGQLRVAMSPIVRSTRKHMTYSPLGNEGEFAYTYPERALDVNLRVEIPLDHLLIVAPSEEGRVPSSLGYAFFSADSAAEKQEHVLVMVPRMFRIETEAAAKK